MLKLEPPAEEFTHSVEISLPAGFLRTRDDLHALAERVAKLEAQNRRLKQAGIAALVLASAAVLMGQTQTRRVLEANEFHLKDADGSVRARLSTDAANRPILSLLDAKGGPVASLGGGRQPFLVLFRPETNEQIRLGANTAFFGLGLYEKEIRAGLAVRDSTPGLDLFDESGTAQATIVARPTGSRSYLNAEINGVAATSEPGPRHQILLLLRAGPVSLHFYA